MSIENKEEYAKAISLFLAELLRTRKIRLVRAAEIAQKVVDNVNLIDTEEQFLKFSKVLSADFQELFHLPEKISFDIELRERRYFEDNVRAFAIHSLGQDIKLTSDILDAAIQDGSNVNSLCEKFPQFKKFMEQIHA